MARTVSEVVRPNSASRKSLSSRYPIFTLARSSRLSTGIRGLARAPIPARYHAAGRETQSACIAETLAAYLQCNMTAT
jgi:hypothetical protein